MNYRKGDLIRILEPETKKIDRIYNKQINIFVIDKIEGDVVSLKDYQDALTTAAIEPIPIDGTSDFNIYYDPIIAASIVAYGEGIPIHHTNYTYYLERFKSCFLEEKSFHQLIQERDLKYVHQIQHFLIDEFNDYGLKANLY